MVPERVMQPLKMTDLLLEACPGRMGPLSQTWGLPLENQLEESDIKSGRTTHGLCWYMAPLGLGVASFPKNKRGLDDSQCPLLTNWNFAKWNLLGTEVLWTLNCDDSFMYLKFFTQSSDRRELTQKPSHVLISMGVAVKYKSKEMRSREAERVKRF